MNKELLTEELELQKEAEEQSPPESVELQNLVFLLGDDYQYSGFDIVFNAWKKTTPNITKAMTIRFFSSFYKGFINRPSKKITEYSQTLPDEVINIVLKTKVRQLTNSDLELIKFGHKISMSAENIIGLILEEYIHDTLITHGWSCCWGNTIKSVDFCSKDGELLQIKNKTNTENSSSNKIRNGTPITVWHSLNAITATIYWENIRRKISSFYRKFNNPES